MQQSNPILTAFAAVILCSTSIQAQGTLYVSNIDETPTGSELISSDSWFAQVFTTGTNPDGYALNSVQLRMDSSSGSPSGFEAFLYSSSGRRPTDSLGVLAGPDPAAGGVFSFTSSPIFLSPSSYYYVVVRAATLGEQGAYAWSTTSASATVSGWDIPDIGRYHSTDGSTWTFVDRLNVFQMAIDATAVPEPTAGALLGLGLVAFWLYRRRPRN